MPQIITIEDETQQLKVTAADMPPSLLATDKSYLVILEAINIGRPQLILSELKFDPLDPPVGSFIYKMKFTLVDGRTAIYNYTVLNPQTFQVTFVTGEIWSDIQVAILLAIKNAAVACVTSNNAVSIKWTNKLP